MERMQYDNPSVPLVFISFATPNQGVAHEICDALEAEGIPCWVCWRIPSGHDYPLELARAIKRCRVFVLVFSRASDASKEVAKEVMIAMDSEKTIIPFRIEPANPSSSLTYHLAGKQWMDSFAADHHPSYPLLAQRIRQELESTGAKGDSAPASPTSKPVEHGPARSRRKIWLAACGVALVVLAAIGVFAWRARTPSDDVIHSAVAARLHEAMDARAVSIDCTGCNAEHGSVAVQVTDGSVRLTGSAAAAELAAIHAVNLQMRGVRAVSYELTEQIPPQAKSAAPAETQVATKAGKGGLAASKISPQSMPTAAVEQRTAETPEQLRARAFVMSGQEQLRKGNWVSAENYFQAALDLDAKNADARAGMEEAKKKLE